MDPASHCQVSARPWDDVRTEFCRKLDCSEMQGIGKRKTTLPRSDSAPNFTRRSSQLLIERSLQIVRGPHTRRAIRTIPRGQAFVLRQATL